ncbi:hypothetical protein BgiMline_021109, partial [Biomphalaria glabrata]
YKMISTYILVVWSLLALCNFDLLLEILKIVEKMDGDFDCCSGKGEVGDAGVEVTVGDTGVEVMVGDTGVEVMVGEISDDISVLVEVPGEIDKGGMGMITDACTTLDC